MRIARFLVGGVDLWLNNPRRPLEASGTSGMKAAINGIPSMSILDGWWDEGFNGDNGWAIGDRGPEGDEAAQDAADAEEIYRLLEEEIVPRFFDRRRGVPIAWVGEMRAGDRGGAVAVQHGPHADRVCRPPLPAGRPRSPSKPDPPQAGSCAGSPTPLWSTAKWTWQPVDSPVVPS